LVLDEFWLFAGDIRKAVKVRVVGIDDRPLENAAHAMIQKIDVSLVQLKPIECVSSVLEIVPLSD